MHLFHIKLAGIRLVRPYRLRVGAYRDAQTRKQLCRNGSRSHTADGLTAGGTAAAPVIPESILFIKGVIRMAGTVDLHDVSVIPRSLVRVHHRHGNRGPRCPSLKDTGKNFHPVRLLAFGRKAALPRFSAV